MESDKLYSEVQQITDLPASALRFWEEQFSCLNPRKDSDGNQFYTMENINLIKQIKFFHFDLGIDEISMIISFSHKSGPCPIKMKEFDKIFTPLKWFGSGNS